MIFFLSYFVITAIALTTSNGTCAQCVGVNSLASTYVCTSSSIIHVYRCGYVKSNEPAAGCFYEPHSCGSGVCNQSSCSFFADAALQPLDNMQPIASLEAQMKEIKVDRVEVRSLTITRAPRGGFLSHDASTSSTSAIDIGTVMSAPIRPDTFYYVAVAGASNDDLDSFELLLSLHPPSPTFPTPIRVHLSGRLRLLDSTIDSTSSSSSTGSGGLVVVAVVVVVVVLTLAALVVAMAAVVRLRRRHIGGEQWTMPDVETSSSSSSSMIRTATGLYANSEREEEAASARLPQKVQDKLNSIDQKKYIIDPALLQKKHLIGAGGYGSVWYGLYRDIQEVAVKEVNAASSDDALLQLVNEAVALANLRPHVNVLAFYGIAKSVPLALVTAYANGGSLDALLYGDKRHSQPLTLENTRSIVIGIAKGLAHLHSESIVHRDLAARNILLDKGGGEFFRPLLADYGLSRELAASDDATQVEQEQHTISKVGPIKWMAPEAIRDSIYSRQTDVFSFGVLLFEIYTLSPPWHGFSNITVASRVLEGEVLEVPKSAPSVIRKLMRRCFDLTPSIRPTAAAIVKKLLSEWNDEAATNKNHEITGRNSVLFYGGLEREVSTASLDGIGMMGAVYEDAKEPIDGRYAPLKPTSETNNDTSNTNITNSTSESAVAYGAIPSSAGNDEKSGAGAGRLYASQGSEHKARRKRKKSLRKSMM